MSKTRIALLIALLLAAPPAAAKPNLARIFAGRDGCFELYDLKTNKLVTRYNPKQCAKRVSPCSTFKVPLSLMVFDAGILKNEKSMIKWDGKKSGRPEWNRNQTAASWMKLSVVWFSQRLTPKLGMNRIKSYLTSFRYGNADMSGGITQAWLQSSLLISADEQLRFWRLFWREELPVSKHAFAVTKKITYLAKSPKGWALHGKTGSSAMVKDGRMIQGLGWFVGHVSKGNREYLFVTNYTDRDPPADARPPGWVARDISTKILGEMGLY